MIVRILLFIALVFLASCSLRPDTGTSETGSLVDSGASSLKELTEDERIAFAKKRRSYITGIRKGDFYSLRNAPEEALSYYLTVAEKLPDDPVIRKKIASVYSVMKNWSRAYDEYMKVPKSELDPTDMEELLRALFFDDTTYDRLGELQKLSLGTGALDYYGAVDICYSTIHNCIVHIMAYTGTEQRLVDLQNQIQKAEKISPDYQYRNLLVAAKYYEQGMYRAAETILRELLVERPDYMEAKKILGLALFHLGLYEESKKYLLAYLDTNPKDKDTIVFLGEVHFALGDYASSNLYLNNAILAGYTPKTNLERRLAYNYALLDDTVGMMKVLNYLLQEDDVTEDDYIVGISAAIERSDYTRAISWSQAGLQKFPDSLRIRPLYIEALRLDGQIDNASALIQNTDAATLQKNPNFLLEKAIIAYTLGDIETAKEIFTELSTLEDWPDITEEARIYLARMATASGTTTP